jgi:hypothetical protein
MRATSPRAAAAVLTVTACIGTTRGVAATLKAQPTAVAAARAQSTKAVHRAAMTNNYD